MSFPTAPDILKRTSYPYLWVARRFDLPYELVLRVADAVRERYFFDLIFPLDGNVFFDLRAVLPPPCPIGPIVELIADLNRSIRHHEEIAP